ncbi:hypothetical protein D9613_010484 [Agrocybe pediades]|uniref:Uncharacterized protein n=1 Tax=Agrocybe pediades TaxID=84607 RepID=A0A8H4QFI6_9AGAR|nr:hypothetical protein D9613_010484 [Agrocybe pediades]
MPLTSTSPMSIASGILYYLAERLNSPLYTLISTFLTPIVNIILTGLLAARILYQQTRLSKLLGSAMSRQSPYTKIAMMCIESSALIVLVGVACIITTFVAYLWSGFPYMILPHICVISPVLIVYRVAQGRSLETVTSDCSEGRMSAINFQGDAQSGC